MNSKASPKLTPKQAEFCNQYMIDLNGKQAAIRAGYSAKTAENQASRLLSNAKVQQMVSKLQGKTREKTEITKQEILNELSAIAFADIRDYLWFDGFTVRFKPFSELTGRQSKAIESVKQTSSGIELKLHGKNWSIERVCKLLGYDAAQDINLQLDRMDEASIDQIINRIMEGKA